MKFLMEPLKRKRITIWFALLIIAGGIYFFISMPKQEFPQISSPGAIMTVVYPGASAAEVEDQVTIPIEEHLTFINGIETLSSYSMENVSIIVIYLENDIDSEKEWNSLRLHLSDIEQILPDSAYINDLETDLVNTAGMIISIRDIGDDYLLSEYKAEELKDEIVDLDDVSDVIISGTQEQFIKVELINDIVNNTTITVSDIYNIILAQTTEIPLGGIFEDGESVKLSIPANVASIEELENLIIGQNEFGPITLSMVSNIYIDNEEGLYYEYDDHNVILLSVYFDEKINSIPLNEEINSVINSFLEENQNTEIDIIYNTPVEISNSLNSFLMNLIISIGIVIGVVLIWMSFRNTIVVAIAIPLTIAGTFMIMGIFGVYIEQISIAALIISLGILVDNSIVISNAIQVKLDEGLKPIQAAFEGTKESSVPMLTATLTTIASFLPLAFLPGEAGEFARSLPIVVSIAIGVSYILALFVSPTFALITFRKKNITKKKFNEKVDNILKKVFRRIHKLRYFVLPLSLLLLAGSFYLILGQPIKMFPAAEKQYFYIDVINDKNSLDATSLVMDEINDILDNTDGISNYISSIGGGIPKFYPTVLSPLEDVNKGQYLVTIDFDTKVGQDFVYALQLELNDNLSSGYAIVSEFELTNPGAPISVRIASTDEDKLLEINDLIYSELKDMDGTINVSTTKPSYISQYEIDLNELALLPLSLTKIEVQMQINEAIIGKTLDTYIDGEDHLQILVKTDLVDIEDLNNFEIRYTNQLTSEYEKIKLEDIATINSFETLETIQRINSERSMEVNAYVAPGYGVQNINSQLSDFIDDLDDEDVSYYYGGEQQTFERYIKDIGKFAILAVILIYMIMFLQFKTFTQPLVILMTIPLSFIGTFLSVWIFDLDISFTMGLGMASLMGIVVNNGILLIEYINRERDKGISVKDACAKSVIARFRPIMISSITTICGLIPLAINGGDFFKPLAVALMGGLTLSTLLTLIIIPALYQIVSKIEN